MLYDSDPIFAKLYFPGWGWGRWVAGLIKNKANSAQFGLSWDLTESLATFQIVSFIWPRVVGFKLWLFTDNFEYVKFCTWVSDYVTNLIVSLFRSLMWTLYYLSRYSNMYNVIGNKLGCCSVQLEFCLAGVGWGVGLVFFYKTCFKLFIFLSLPDISHKLTLSPTGSL